MLRKVQERRGEVGNKRTVFCLCCQAQGIEGVEGLEGGGGEEEGVDKENHFEVVLEE